MYDICIRTICNQSPEAVVRHGIQSSKAEVQKQLVRCGWIRVQLDLGSFWIHSLKSDIAPENRPFAPKGSDHIPTIHF